MGPMYTAALSQSRVDRWPTPKNGTPTSALSNVCPQGAIKIPVAIEDEVPRDLPWGTTLFRPIRQMVYAVLFNMHHVAFVARQKREAAAQAATSAGSSTATDSAPGKTQDGTPGSEGAWSLTGAFRSQHKCGKVNFPRINLDGTLESGRIIRKPNWRKGHENGQSDLLLVAR